MTRSRQLVAIMFTDIEGYTALMQKDEKKAMQTREKHRDVFNSITKRHKGRVLQYYGDGTLSIFDSAIEAVKCGIEMQLGFQEDPLIPVRIGIHTGDIIFSEEEIIGDGVNVASRIESLAVAGSVLVSDKVYDEIKNQESIQASKLKTFKLKNIEKPIEVYAITNVGLVVPKPEDIKGKTDKDVASPSLKKEKSIAVLAFENMSGDPEQEYFSDGISEEILNSLVHVNGLKVAGRTSAFSFKGKDEDLRTIGEKLDVKMILEGSVRKAGNRVRITAQLINVRDGFHIWSEIYNREMEDIFAVQEDIANRIVERLKLQVHDESQENGHTPNPEAYELVLKGNYFLRKDYLDKKKALDYFKKAVALDPAYAEAYAYIGETYIQHAGYNLISAADAHAKARIVAQQAIDLNPREPRAHMVLAYTHLFYDWDWEAAQTEYEKAIKYGLPEKNEFIVYFHIFLRKDYDYAIRVSQQILESDPLHVINHWQLGICYYFARRFKEALISLENALELDPNYSDAHHWKGLVLGYLG
ncbi:MAG: tetratricopeptide repeat protein, partial [Saprospiraceae bacterium]|nr:tetratricopeptide repeat protein [Saprospiraceae bacterium]